MKNFDSRTYNIADFIEWNENGILELSPDFQRRSVWTENAKSYLIDTIVCGKPIPKLLISQKFQGKKNLRIVVDGQQRMRAIIGFYNGDFKISRIHNDEFGGKTFDTLPEEMQNEFLKYELSVDVLFDLTYEDTLDVFARINSYSVNLKPQEIFNAKYVGYFKQTIFKYGIKYVGYLISAGVLTKSTVARMSEAELSADLFVSLVDEVKTKKGIESYYIAYEDDEKNLPDAREKFDKIMSYIGEIYPPHELRLTNWKRVQLFYTLFTSIGHCLYGLKGLNEDYRIQLNIKLIGKIRIILDEISLKYDEYTENKDIDIPSDYKDFINYSRRGTTDTTARISRSNFVCNKLKNALLAK